MTSESTTADRLTAVVLFLLGLAMLWGGFEMDRLEIRRIHPASIPGLVPMFLGAILMICAVCLAVARPLQKDGASASPPSEPANWTDLAFTGVWSCVFALLMVGNMPFAAASGIYVAVFSGWFLWPSKEGTLQRVKLILLIALFAGASAIGISTLFEDGFLVRLP